MPHERTSREEGLRFSGGTDGYLPFGARERARVECPVADVWRVLPGRAASPSPGGERGEVRAEVAAWRSRLIRTLQW